MARRVFLSFKAEDRKRVDGLRLLAANPNFEIEFYDESVRDPYDSTNANYIKSKLTEKITRASVTVCLISEDTHTSEWVNWELEKSLEKGNKIIAMALKDVSRAVLPRKIKELNLTFHSWDHEHLAKLINS
ncbi:molecular chaperone Tir [Bacteriovorax stolpii]|uniref:Molecular chaperone Tir n=1 Tax=Bacteriovorax stolpii TaxID=960 RepID=A0A2K9NWF1_BACTC|nr:TIR domain-containing protein [Bacteriovorax stolpii]AUN99084.1 molecular chaperone Tir [Bacteriovorax stolpii]TDP55386.1 TIR-like protein DUF1863 [Bacteriovorax stolpii]